MAAGPDLSSWYSAVAGVLAKSQRKDPSEMPEDAWTSLVATTRDGVPVNPLYTRADELAERTPPGEFPYIRGGDREGLPENGWHVSAQVDVRGRATDANTQILDLLGEGVSALWLSTAPEEVAPALKGVLLDLAPVTFNAGTATTSVAEAFIRLLDERRKEGDGVESRSAIRANFGAAPLTAERNTVSLDEAVRLAQDVAAREESLRTFIADGTGFHAAGAGDAQELAYAVTAGLDYVRAMIRSGMSTVDALNQVAFRLAATDDQFQSIAKFRAGRALWARVAEVLGAPEAGAAPQHAVTSAAMMSRRDPWVNMLRTTLAAFGAGVGGATEVTVLPFDSSIPGGLESTSRSFADRMARNIQLLLLEESHLGHVVDPAGGSWYVEVLTDQLASAAWEILQSIESEGGLGVALQSGLISTEIAALREARDNDIAHRTAPITGVSEFPNLTEPPLDASRRGGESYRYGRAFEELRDRSDAHLESTGSRPLVLIAGLGPQAETTARVTFIANLLAAGGIEARNPGITSANEIPAAISGETIAVLCGADKRYATEGSEAVRALRAAGVRTVLAAGSAKGFSTEPDPDEAGTPDGYLGIGLDAVAALSDLHAKLGVK